MTDQGTKSRVVRFMLRLPADLDRTTVENAQKRNRSKNNYIVSVLREASALSGRAEEGVGPEMDEQIVLKWFRGCTPKKKRALLDFLEADLDDQ